MFKKLGDHIANCLVRAADAERRAAEASSEDVRIDYERIAKTWRHLASSYQFVEGLERSLLHTEKTKAARRPHPPTDAEIIPLFPPQGAIFDPEAIAVLTAAYQKAIDGQPASVHEIIAKRILELASEGEHDPVNLYRGALALSMYEPRSPT